jgi:hypothetical protein
MADPTHDRLLREVFKRAQATENINISEAEYYEWLREPMVFYGDYIDVNLRGVSDDAVRKFALHVGMNLRPRDVPLEKWLTSDELYDALDEAAFNAVSDLFGSLERTWN